MEDIVNVWAGVTAFLYRMDTQKLKDAIGSYSVSDNSDYTYIGGVTEVGVEWCKSSESWSSALRQNLLDSNNIRSGSSDSCEWRYERNTYFLNHEPAERMGAVFIGVSGLQPSTSYKVRSYAVLGTGKVTFQESTIKTKAASSNGIRYTLSYGSEYEVNKARDPEYWQAKEAKTIEFCDKALSYLNAMSNRDYSFTLNLEIYYQMISASADWMHNTLNVNINNEASEELIDTVLHEMSHLLFPRTEITEKGKEFMRFATKLPYASYTWQGNYSHCYPITFDQKSMPYRAAAATALSDND